MDSALRTVDASDLDRLPRAAQDILVAWLLNYDPEDGAQLLGVEGRAEAIAAIRKWALP